MTEIWLPMACTPHCFISDHGRVARRINAGRKGRVQWRMYATELDKDGYHRVHLRLDRGSYARRLVHREVYAAFVGDLQQGMVVCHNDGDRTNNTPTNLCQTTQMDNIQDNFIHDAIPYGVRHGQHILIEDQVRAIKRGYDNGMSLVALADTYGVHRKTIADIVVYKRLWVRVQ